MRTVFDSKWLPGVCTARLNRSTQSQCAGGYRQGRSSSAPVNTLRETDPGLNGGRELHVTRTARRSAVWPRAPTSSAAYTARSSCCLHARIVGSLFLATAHNPASQQHGRRLHARDGVGAPVPGTECATSCPHAVTARCVPLRPACLTNEHL